MRPRSIPPADSCSFRGARRLYSWSHHRHGNRGAGGDESLETHVAAATRPGIVAADDQIGLIGSNEMCQRFSLTENAGRRSEEQWTTCDERERTKQQYDAP